MRFAQKFSVVLTFSLFFLSFSWGAPVSVSSDETDLATRSNDVDADLVSDLAIRAHPHEFAKAVLKGQAARKDRKDAKKAGNAGKSHAQIRANRQANKDARRNALNANVRSAAARATSRANAAARRASRKASGTKAPPPQKKNAKNQMKADWRKPAKGAVAPSRPPTHRNPKIPAGGSFPTKRPVARTSTKPKRVRSAAGKKKARINHKRNAQAKKAARAKAPGGRVVRPKKQQISKQINDAAKYMQSTVGLPGRKDKFEYSRTGAGTSTNVRQTGKDVRKGIMNGQLFAKQGVPGDPGHFQNRPYPAGHPLSPNKPLTNGGREYPVVSGHLGWQKDPSQDRGVVRVITSDTKNTAGKTVPKFEGVVTHDSTYGAWGEHYKVPNVP